MEGLKSFIFALLLDGHIGNKSWKISSLLLELKDLILAPLINMLKSFIFALLLETTNEERENGKI